MAKENKTTKKSDTILGCDITIRVPRVWIEFLKDYYEWAGHDDAEEYMREALQEMLAQDLKNRLNNTLRNLRSEYPYVYEKFSKKHPYLIRTVTARRLCLKRDGYAKINFD